MTDLGHARRCAVLGSPVAHSLSPALHRAAYAALALDWTYEAIRVEAADLDAFVAGLDESWRGLSLTMPLKQAVVALGEPDEVVRFVGVGNTLILDGDRRTVHNTDVGGLVAALRAGGVASVESATLLGNGATARSALVALAKLGARQVVVFARDAAKTQRLVDLGVDLGVTVSHRPWESFPIPTDALVSTVPADIASEVAGAFVAATQAVFDVIYDPWPTPLALAGMAHGLAVVNGLDLLVHQAVEQVLLMTGQAIAPEILLSAGRAELLRRRTS